MSSLDYEMPAATRLVLEKRTYCYQYVVRMAERREYEELSRFGEKNAIKRLSVHVASRVESLDEKREYRHPETWWDAFKVRFFPRWALLRWPAAEKVVTFRVEAEAVALFPEREFLGHRGEMVLYGFENVKVL